MSNLNAGIIDTFMNKYEKESMEGCILKKKSILDNINFLSIGENNVE